MISIGWETEVVGTRLVVVHDRADGSSPGYLPALSSIGAILTVGCHGTARLRTLVDAPWLIDIETPDGNKVSLLRAAMIGTGDAPRVLVASVRNRRALVQAHALGATAVLPRPVTVEAVRRIIFPKSETGGGADRQSEVRSPPAETLGTRSIAAAAVLLDQVFSACVDGGPIDASALRHTAALVGPAIQQISLAAWLDLVRRHHTGTYRHILQVMGIAVCFGQAISLREDDIDRLALGALLHDIGKCWAPEALLDKPGKLTETEFTIVKRHSFDGWAALRTAELALDDEVCDMVLHHHEYVDGSGYPDGLVGAAIHPLTRILTVCDIYGALIEERSYRPPIPPLRALSILEEMALAGKIDGSLVGILFRLHSRRRPHASLTTSRLVGMS